MTSQIFDNRIKKSYKLDDFTRFKTLEETIVEVISDVSIQRLKDQDALNVKSFDFNTTITALPLVLLDGAFIENQQGLLNYDARKISEITVFRDIFIIGPKVFKGALLIHSFSENGYDELGSYSNTFSILKPQTNKSYFKQTYKDSNDVSHMPDDRLQLLWEPDVLITKNDPTIEFYTSDVTGKYEVHLEGYTKNGQEVLIKQTFEVK